MLILFLQFLIRLFFFRPRGIVPGQRAVNTSALFWAIEDHARRHFYKRTQPMLKAGSLPTSRKPADDLFFGL